MMGLTHLSDILSDDYSLAITGLIGIMRGAPDSIMNVYNPESVDTNDDSITDDLPIVQSSTNGLSQTESDNILFPRPFMPYANSAQLLRSH